MDLTRRGNRMAKRTWICCLGEYRKMDPGPIEEFVFFDHPSGRTRITAAMRWKAEHPEAASPEELARPMFPTL